MARMAIRKPPKYPEQHLEAPAVQIRADHPCKTWLNRLVRYGLAIRILPIRRQAH